MLTKQQEKRLDDLRRQAVKNIYPVCQITGRTPVDDHHIFGRGFAVRWNILNSISVHRSFHVLEKSTDPKDREYFHATVKNWFINKFSKEAFYALEELSKETAHNLDYEEIRQSLIKYIDK